MQQVQAQRPSIEFAHGPLQDADRLPAQVPPASLRIVPPKIEVELEVGGGQAFWFAKRCFDIAFSLILLVPLAATVLVLAVVNPFLNRGPLFFYQIRMGRDCKAFQLIKFRTMVPISQLEDRRLRGHDDAIDCHRITRLGGLLRATRIDELPQVLNVLNGDMSLIGPRPDYFNHARVYVRLIPGYRERHMVRPGISGLAQVENGYAEGIAATHQKAQLDLHYIREASASLEYRIFLKTLRTVFLRNGR